jgi:chemotaxis protein MotA
LDIVSIIGIIVGLSAVLLGQFLEGGHIGSLLQLTAFMIVVGGTVGAVMLQSSLRVFLDGLNLLKWVFKPPRVVPQETLQTLLEWSQHARRGGLLALEPFIEQQPDLFQRRGLQMLVDGAEPEVLRDTLELDLQFYEQHHIEASKIWMAAGGYSPTIGILGAVMGLIHVMENLNDPSKLGSGIATAFVATVYGVGSANILFLPIATKLELRHRHEIIIKEMILEGIVSVSMGENPRLIEEKLISFLSEKQKNGQPASESRK